MLSLILNYTKIKHNFKINFIKNLLKTNKFNQIFKKNYKKMLFLRQVIEHTI